MCPSTEPITTLPEEPFGDEKNGTSLLYDHRTSPLSWDKENTHQTSKCTVCENVSSVNKVTKVFTQVWRFLYSRGRGRAGDPPVTPRTAA